MSVPTPPIDLDMRQCPYDPAHMVKNGVRFQKHLKKCRKDKLADTRSPYHANAVKLKICPYSTFHHIHEDVFEEHKRNCDKKLVSAYNTAPDEVPAWKWRPAKVEVTDTAEEDWEAEADVEVTYNPEQKIQRGAGKILYNPIGKTRSEKKRFRQNQRLARYSGESAWDEDEPEAVVAWKGKPAKTEATGTVKEDWELEVKVAELAIRDTS